MNEQLCVLPHDVERLAQDGHYLCPGHVKALPERIRQLAGCVPLPNRCRHPHSTR